MSNPSTVKIECPACGQHYSLELASGQTVVTCEKCGAEFTATRQGGTQPLEPPAGDDAMPEPVPTAPLERPAGRGSSLVDGFLAFMFRFGKSFAGILAVGFMLGIVASGLVFLLNFRSGMEVPTYDQIVADAPSAQGAGYTGGASQLDERRDIERRFGDAIAGVVKKYALGESAYDGLLRAMKEIKRPYRKDYVGGLDDALQAAERAKAKGEAKSLSPGEVAEAYTEAFVKAEEQAAVAAETARTNRWGAAGSALLCCCMLFMMLVIPALLKIEENTRKG